MKGCSAHVRLDSAELESSAGDTFPLSSFTAIAQAVERPDSEPPRKRVRHGPVTHDVRIGVNEDGDIVFPDDVVVARVDLQLIFDDTEALAVDQDDTVTYDTPFTVHPDQLHQARGSRFDLSLGHRNGRIRLNGRVDKTSGLSNVIEQMDEWCNHAIPGISQRPVRSLYTLRAGLGNPKVARLQAWLLWRKGTAAVDIGNKSAQSDQLEVLSTYWPELPIATSEKWALSDFYDNVHVPTRSDLVPQPIQEVDLQCTLYPFQQRAVAWLLKREKVAFEGGQLASIARREADAVPTAFVPTKDANGSRTYFSSLQKMFLDHPANHPDLHGGILCEEMGLGKTVELLALITLHRRNTTPHRGFESLVDGKLIKSNATLIISPPHILSQWQSEIARHAPQLRVLHYKGMQVESKSKDRDLSDPLALLEYDIVLTTYGVLAREIHYAETPPQRNFRHAKKHEPRRSPLIQLSWWRVCLDEAQMIEGGVSKAATVARLIPRINAFAVSGTPLKKDLDDLFGLILFLWHEPYCLSKKVWTSVGKDLFARIIGNIAMRHTKDMVRQELRIPEQKRVVLTMPFTTIEEQNYSQLMQQMCEDCGLTAEGAPVMHGIDFTSTALVEKMRSWLRRLRQTCLHPQVGDKNRRALGRKGPLKTVNEVLDTMIEQNETALRAEQRQVVLARVRHTHVLANDKSNTERWPAALETYKQVLKQATDFVDVIRGELDEERRRRPASTTPSPSNSEADSSSDGEAGREPNQRLVALQKALRSALEVRHVCAFFVGTAYYQLKMDDSRTSPESDDFHRLEKLESEYYEEAKALRREMLGEWDSAARRLMRKVAASRDKLSLPKVPLLDDKGGIESRKYLSNLDNLANYLDKQATFVEKIRAKVIEYLLLDLIDQDEGKETTGEEYEDSTKKQDELPIYVTVLATAVADRHLLLTGQINFLVDHETKEAEKTASRAEGHAPELLLELLKERADLVPKRRAEDTSGSLRELVSQIRSTVTGLQWAGGEDDGTRANRELAIVNKQLREAQQILTAQSKVVTELEKDLELFRTTMNQRNEFYRQLQIVSDTVAPYKDELDETLDRVALHKEATDQAKSEQKLAALNTKRRFLLHLQTESTSKDARICVICQGDFELGVLTVCGHQYCKDCIRLWWKAHRTCPVCKRHLSLVDFHDITYNPNELRAQEEGNLAESASPNSSQADSPKGTQIYAAMNANTLKEIKAIDLSGSYGTKIDTVAKHILWIREHDPGAKSIIFSQFGDFLQVLGGAFRTFKIGYTAYDDRDGVNRFKQDASVECLLLDAKSDSSGLNLINATHVFFCEPLINTAIELQAIARVHRIGQQRNTTVYMYLVSDSVEESIYDLSVSRRMAHIGGNKGKQSRSGTTTPKLEEMALDIANSLELQQAPVSTLLVKGKSGGEVVRQDDLWQCLFGKSRTRRENVSDEMQREVDTFLRAEAADDRRTAGLN